MALRFDWKITAKKVLISLAEIILCGGLAYLQNDQRLLVLVPVIEAVRNVLKHRYKIRIF